MHSVLSGVRCTRFAYQVWPISTRRFVASTLKKRVQPTIVPEASRTTNGIASSRSRMSSAVATYSAIRSGAPTPVYQSRHSSPSRAASASAAACDAASGSSVAWRPFSVTGSMKRGGVRDDIRLRRAVGSETTFALRIEPGCRPPAECRL